MSISIVDHLYVQSVGAEFELKPPVAVVELARPHHLSLGTVGEVLGSACIQHIVDDHVEAAAVYGEKLRDFADRFDAELEARGATDPTSVREVLHDAFAAQGIEITEVPNQFVNDVTPPPANNLQSRLQLVAAA